MREKLIKYVTVVLALSFCWVTIGSSLAHTNDTSAASTTDKICDINDVLYHGEAKRGMLTLESTHAEGIPDVIYSGIMSNLTITLTGHQAFYLIPLPWIILSTFFENDGTMFVTMDFFWGYINPTFNTNGYNVSISGFVKNIQWDWE